MPLQLTACPTLALRKLRERRFLPQLCGLARTLLFITTTAALVVPANLHAQAVPSATPPQAALPSAPPQQQEIDLSTLPRATPLPPEKPPQPISWDSDTETRQDDLYTLSGNVEVHYGSHILRADTITYDAATAEMTLTGHIVLTGGNNDEHIEATHGTYNVKLGTGRFYDVKGSVQVHDILPAQTSSSSASVVGRSTAPQRQGYLTSNPFLFEGRVVVKTGPEDYVVYNGSVTSCLLPHPDWQLFSRKFTIANGVAQAGTSTFRLLGLPVLFLPYVTHPTDTEQRQSGLLIPVFGYSSASNNTGSKGTTIGEQVYLVLGRSVDLTAGILYYSDRGYSENGTVRVRGQGEDFLTAHFSALQDRGFYAPTQTGTNQKTGAPIISDVYTNQGGEDVTIGLRKQLNPTTHVVGDGEYLSSYVYREVFTDNFNQAVSSDITSLLYVAHQDNGYDLSLRGDRYEGLKVIPVKKQPGEEVKIFHAPSVDFTGIDHRIPGTPLLWNIDASAAGLKRVQPNFVSSGIIERLDLRPELSLPLHFAGWNILASVAARETFYSRSRQVPYNLTNKSLPLNPPNAAPIEIKDPINRADFELNIDIRPPAIERTFTVPAKWHWLLGDQVRHTIEPELKYRSVHGVDNFLAVLRFDDVDLVSDTDELRYGVTQHLYLRPRKQKPVPGCPASDLPYAPEPADNDANEAAQRPTNDANGIPDAGAQSPDMPTRTHARRHDPCASTTPLKQQEWFSWELAQKTFFAQNFGGAVINSRRNIFESTLNFSGIAYLTEARAISPIISRMRFRTSSHTDVEWDLDYDTGAKKFNSSNVFLDLHEGNWFGGFSYARLNAPGRSYTPTISTITNTITNVTSNAVSDFSQMRMLIGYGRPSKPGLSAAGGAGIDLNAGSEQYVTLQSGYNWNCCGLSIEYRKYDLGTVRNEGAYRFNFTLANIGSAGNLRRNEALF